MAFEEFFKAVPIGDYPAHKENWDNLGLDGWDNMVYDYTQPGTSLSGITSAKACNERCAADESCFQARFDGQDECMLLTTGFVVGKKRMPDGIKKWESFWNATRIEKWISSQKACPSKVTFRQQIDDL